LLDSEFDGIDRRSDGRRGDVRRSGADAIHAKFDCRPGGEDAVVLVLVHHVRTPAAQKPDDPEWDVADADRFTDGRFVVEQFAFHRGADHADTVARADVVIGKKVAFFQVLPVASGEIARRGSRQLLRDPIALP
jgi:hypothetical protein